MELWSAEIEALRPEARESVATGFDTINEMIGGSGPYPDDAGERARLARKQFEAVYVASPDAVERTIAGVPCRLFPADDVPSAVYLHFHGGGMIMGAPMMNDIPNADLCKRFGLNVVSVDYRLAPEHPFPAGPDDCLAVAQWLVEHAEQELGTARLIIGGESAGGYLSALVALRMRDELDAIDRVAGLNLVFGVYDWGRTPSQRGMRPHEGPDLLDPNEVGFVTDCYLPGRTDDERRDPAISPLYADLHGMPPALMSVGTCDHLVDDTLMLAPRWVAAGNEAQLFVAPEMPHGFIAFPCAMTDLWAERTYAWFADVLAR
jgi:acetyl esterase/lipase